MDHAIVQVFSYDEPDLKRALDAYARCYPPDGWRLSYQACITPRGAIQSAPASYRDLVHRWTEIARAHPVFDLVHTPPGKLASRNAAHDAALEAGAEAVVAGDADAPPLDEDYLAALLAPLQDADVVATNGTPVAPSTPIGVATNVLGRLHDVVVPHMNGQGHAFATDAWADAGPFAVDDQTDSRTVRLEEEFEFRRRLAALGDVVDVATARVRNDTRRTRCRLEALLPGQPSDYCQRIGVETFTPRSSRLPARPRNPR